MKRHLGWLVVGAILGWGHAASAQGVPERVSFTARVLDNGTPVTGSRDFQLTLFGVAAGGAQLWSETHTGVTVANGMAFISMGSITPLDAINLDGGTRWLEITVGATVLTPRLAIESVPYAIRAGTTSNADAVGGVPVDELQRIGLVALADAPNIAVDGAAGTTFSVTVTDNRQLSNPTGLVPGARYTFLVRQDGTGGRVPRWGSAYRFPVTAFDAGDRVSPATGTPIGNMTNGGLAAAFDNAFVQLDTDGARYTGVGNGLIGKSWGAPRRIVRVRAFSSSNFGFHNPANGQVRLSIQGSNDGVAWTDLYVSAATSDVAGLVLDVAISGGLTAQSAFLFHRLRIESLTSDGNDRVAELEFFEDPAVAPNATDVYEFISDGTNLFLVARQPGA